MIPDYRHLLFGLAPARERVPAVYNRGKENPNSKLKDEDIRAIRASKHSLSVIAKTYGISRAQASAIRNRKRWAHIN